MPGYGIAHEHMSSDFRDSAPLTTSLLHRIAAGDAQAVHLCLQQYGGLIYALAQRLSPSQQDADDVLQEIFVDICKNAAHYQPERGSERIFITMIARRHLIHRHPGHSRASTIQSLADVVPPDDTAAHRLFDQHGRERSANAEHTAQALLQLPEEQQHILRLSLYHGLSHHDISRATGLPLETIKTYLRRGLLNVCEQLVTAQHARQHTQISS